MSDNQEDSTPIILVSIMLVLVVLYVKYDSNRDYYNLIFFESILGLGYAIIALLTLILIGLLIYEYIKKKIQQRKEREYEKQLEKKKQKELEKVNLEKLKHPPEKKEKQSIYVEKGYRDEFLKHNPKMDIYIDLDTDEYLYLAEELDHFEEDYLKSYGYKSGNFVHIGESRQMKFWVKMNKVESIEHAFLVSSIYYNLDDGERPVERHIVQKPDILTMDKEGNVFAIEVETGISFKKRKSKLKKKFEEVSKLYLNKCVIVVTDKNYKRSYQRISSGIPVIVRKEFLSFAQDNNII